MATDQALNIYEVLPEILSDIAKQRDQQRAIEDYLVINHRMIRGTFIEIVAHPDKIGYLEDEEMLVFVNAIYQITQEEKIYPKNFFAAKDIKDIKEYEFKKTLEVGFPYTISPVIRVTNEDYMAALTFKEIAHLRVSQMLTYNFQTQRLAKKSVSKKGTLKLKEDIRNKSVNSIIKLMKEGKYSPSTLLFNVLVDGKSKVSYDEGELTIHEGSTLNLIDGAHRVEAIVRIIEENPDFDGVMTVDIKHYPLEKAQHLLSVVNTVNPFDKTLVKYYGGSEYGQEIAKYLMTLPVLKDRIEIKTALSKGISITNFAILSEAIQSIFHPENTKDKYDTQDVLKKFYEYLIPSYEDELVKNRLKNLENSWISHHNMHVGFVAIAKKLYDQYGKDFPVDQITNIINHIDFNRETSDLTEIMGGQGKTNSNKVKLQIRALIEAEVDKILNEE